jgi:hypothetical protein
MLWSGWSPPIVPYGADQTVYLVLETSTPECPSRQSAVERTDLETIVTGLMSGRFDNPIGILAFNTLEHWSVAAISREIIYPIIWWISSARASAASAVRNNREPWWRP